MNIITELKTHVQIILMTENVYQYETKINDVVILILVGQMKGKSMFDSISDFLLRYIDVSRVFAVANYLERELPDIPLELENIRGHVT